MSRSSTFSRKDNEAQRLTFEILSQKLELFGTVLDASDQVLHEASGAPPETLSGVVGSGIEAEFAIYDRARTAAEVEAELARVARAGWRAASALRSGTTHVPRAPSRSISTPTCAACSRDIKSRCLWHLRRWIATSSASYGATSIRSTFPTSGAVRPRAASPSNLQIKSPSCRAQVWALCRRWCCRRDGVAASCPPARSGGIGGGQGRIVRPDGGARGRASSR